MSAERTPAHRTVRPVFCLVWLLVGLACAASGCRSEPFDATYGQRRGRPGGASVNGTAVLADMFRQAGYRVTSRRFLSPQMEQHDVIVWVPDDFDLPASDAVSFLEDWLQGGAQRTLVYVGRDYDARIDYWECLRAEAPPEQAVEVLRRLARARATHAGARARMPQDAGSDWFRMRSEMERRWLGEVVVQDSSLDGTWQEAEPVAPDQVAPRLYGRLEPPPPDSPYRTEILLAADQNVLAYRLTRDEWHGSQLLVVANGSFLLNLPLVHAGHRQWAGQLIRDCGDARSVVFLESGPGGPPLLLQEPHDRHPTGLEAFTTWPLGAILWHFLALGIVFLFARVKIFGRPQELPPEPLSDFGYHVQALGELLAGTGDEQYARAELEKKISGIP